jgi:hypothetical protein
MPEIDDFDIKRGSHIVIRDINDEYKIVFEGTVIDFKEYEGTNITRIVLDTPLWIEATEV